MRLPVNVARGFTPVSEVDMEDDWRPSAYPLLDMRHSC
jgi:hypothetical protein